MNTRPLGSSSESVWSKIEAGVGPPNEGKLICMREGEQHRERRELATRIERQKAWNERLTALSSDHAACTSSQSDKRQVPELIKFVSLTFSQKNGEG